MDAREAFAKVLKEKRLEKEMSQEQLAGVAGVSMRFISLLECNKRQATISTIEILADALDISMAEFIQDIESAKDSKK